VKTSLNIRNTIRAALATVVAVQVSATAGYLVSAEMATRPETSESDSAVVPVWSQWRGPDRDGRVDGPLWPETLGGLEQTWRVELGKGYGGPIVTEHRIFVTETVVTGSWPFDKTLARVRAFDRETGAEVWRREWLAEGRVPFYAARSGDWERSTPAFDGKLLYLGDMREVLRALDAETGQDRWVLDVPDKFGEDTPSFGFASSPMLFEGALFAQASNGLIKVDPSTGTVLWRSMVSGSSVMNDGAFSSPIVAELDGIRQIVVFTRSELAGVDPDSGDVLWRQSVPNFRGMNIVTPTVYDGGIFISQYRNGSFFLRPTRVDPLSVDTEDVNFDVETVWTNKGSGYMSSPLVIGDHVYQHLGNGRLTSIDLRTGEENWRTRPMADYWSMVYQGDRMLTLDSEGTLRLIRASPERFDLIDELEVAKQTTWGHLAVSGDGVFVRELEAISAFRWAD